MDQRCGYSGCPGSPKFTCRQDRNQVFCEEHISNHLKESGKHEQISLEALQKSDHQLLAVKKIGENSAIMSGVLLTGKDMFQQICDKLCQITDQLIERQNALSEIATSVNEYDDPLERIEKLGEINLKLRSKEEFGKLVNQHFSKQDSTVDFTLFKSDIEGIVNSIQLSNEFMERIRQEAAKDKEERQKIIAELNNVKESSVRIEKTLDDRIGGVTNEMRARERYLADASVVEAIQNKIQVIEHQVMTSNNIVNQVSARCDFLGGRIELNQKMNQETEANQLKFITEINDLVEVRLATLETDYDGKIADFNKNRAEREEAFRAEETRIKLEIEEKMRNEIKALSDIRDNIVKKINQTVNDVKSQIEKTKKNCIDQVKNGISQVNENFRNELEKTQTERLEVFEWIKRQIEEGGPNRKVVGFEDFKKLEAIRIEEERIRAEQKRLDDIKKEKERQEKLRKEEAARQKKLKIDAENAAKRQREEKIRAEQQQKIEEEQKKKKAEDKNNFNNLPLEEKKKYLASLNLQDYKTTFIDKANYYPIHEIKISNDGLFAFVCKNYSGISK